MRLGSLESAEAAIVAVENALRPQNSSHAPDQGFPTAEAESEQDALAPVSEEYLEFETAPDGSRQLSVDEATEAIASALGTLTTLDAAPAAPRAAEPSRPDPLARFADRLRPPPQVAQPATEAEAIAEEEADEAYSDEAEFRSEHDESQAMEDELVAEAAGESVATAPVAVPATVPVSARPSAGARRHFQTVERPEQAPRRTPSARLPQSRTLYLIVSAVCFVVLIGAVLTVLIAGLGGGAQVGATGPRIAYLASSLALVVVLGWVAATFVWRSNELRDLGSNLNTALAKLSQPETTAGDSISSLGQAIRREIASVSDSVERAIARVSELEIQVHSEVSALERAYHENEVRMKALIGDFRSQREAILTNSESLKASIVAAQEALALDLRASSEAIAENVGRSGSRITQAISTRVGQQVTAALGWAGETIVNRLGVQGDELIERVKSAAGEVAKSVAVVGDEVAVALAKRSNELVGMFEKRALDVAGAISDTGTEIAAAMDQGAKHAGAELKETIASLLVEVEVRGEAATSRMDKAAATLDQAMVATTDKLAARLSTVGEEVRSTIAHEASDVADRLITERAEVAEAVNAGVERLRQAIDESSTTVGKVIDDRRVGIAELLAASSNELGEAIAARGERLVERVAKAGQEMSEAIGDNVNAANDLISQTANSVVDRLADAGENLRDRLEVMEQMPRATTAVLAVATDSGRTLSLKEIFSCSPEMAFRAITDVEHVAEIYGPGTLIEQVTAGPLGLGSKFHRSREVGGRSVSELVEVTEFDPPYRVTFAGQSPQARTVRQVSIAGNAHRSTVAVLLTAEPTGVAGKLIPASFAPKMKALGRSLAQELVDIRRFAERSSAPARRLLTNGQAATQDDALWALTNGSGLTGDDYDDLTRIRGIGPVMARKLRQIGVSSYRQLAAFTPADIERVEAQIVVKGRITRDRWVEQAKALAGTIA